MVYTCHIVIYLSHCFILVILCIILITLFFYVLVTLCFRLCSSFAGAIFALHPVHCEAVASAVGRAELLSGFFFVLSVTAYTKNVLNSTGKLGSKVPISSQSQSTTDESRNKKLLRSQKVDGSTFTVSYAVVCIMIA